MACLLMAYTCMHFHAVSPLAVTTGVLGTMVVVGIVAVPLLICIGCTYRSVILDYIIAYIILCKTQMHIYIYIYR